MSSIVEVDLHITGLKRFKARLQHRTADQAKLVLEAAAHTILDFVKSFTGQAAPLDKKHPFPRGAHPGGWGDISNDLVDKYFATVTLNPDGNWQLNVGNTSDHAVFVEAKDGLLVVRGLTEKGGPVAKAIYQANKQLGDRFKVTEVAVGTDAILGDLHKRSWDDAQVKP